MKSKVARLEQALGMWEEFMWSRSLLRQAAETHQNQVALEFYAPNIGPLVHYKELRRHLLTIRNYDEFDMQRFELLLPNQVKHENLGQAGMERNDSSPFDFFAGRLAAWTTSSRRVFRLDPDLQALLGATSPKKLTLGDIKFPFESFLIELVEPIYCPFTDRYSDYILFAPAQGRHEEGVRSRYSITLFNREMSNWRPLPAREALEKKFRRGQQREVAIELERRAVTGRQNYMLMMHMLKERIGVPLTDLLGWIGDMPDKEGIASRQAWQIVIGLAMYLKMLPPNSTHVSAWELMDPNQRLLGSLDHRAITDESEICYVSSTRKLSDADRQLFFDYASGRGGYELSAHFRVGYWHRPKGRGQDPTYPKTQWTHPTLVRKDRLPEGAVPGGSRVEIT